MKPLVCRTPASSHAYEIEIQQNILLEKIPKYLKSIFTRFAIVTDDLVLNLYGKQLYAQLKSEGLEAYLFSFPHGEKNKNRKIKEELENQLFEQGLARDTCIVALGGGVVTDLAGYLAATYCRGLPLVMVPTTLLGMVDASIGGKTGVNVPYGKNMIGCLYPPKKVFIDPTALTTLPSSELKNGFVEVIKHALIADALFFQYLETSHASFQSLELSYFERVIYESCRIKKEIVEEDEKEKGKRRLLNLGHTIGHALECITDYQLPHGHAVAAGILAECYLSMQLGVLGPQMLERVEKIFTQYAISFKIPFSLSFEALEKILVLDKKSLEGKPRFVLLEEVGSCLPFQSNYSTHVEDKFLKKTVEWMNHALCCH